MDKLSSRFDRGKNIINDEIEAEPGQEIRRDCLNSRFRKPSNEVDMSEIEDMAGYRRWIKRQKAIKRRERRLRYCPF